MCRDRRCVSSAVAKGTTARFDSSLGKEVELEGSMGVWLGAGCDPVEWGRPGVLIVPSLLLSIQAKMWSREKRTTQPFFNREPSPSPSA